MQRYIKYILAGNSLKFIFSVVHSTNMQIKKIMHVFFILRKWLLWIILGSYYIF